MELVVILVIIFVIYGAGWIWQTVNDIVGDARRTQWDRGVYGQVASSRSVRKSLGGGDLGLLRQTFQRFAELYDGESHDRQLFESPKVSFTWHGSRALLSIYEANENEARFYSQITFTVPEGWGRRLEIFPQRFQEGDVRYLNVDDIQVGDAEFDPRWVVKSDDPAFAKEFLDARTRQAVEDLRSLVGNDRLLVSLNGSRLMIRKQEILSAFDDLVVFAELASHVCDRVLRFWQRESGIEIMDEPAGVAAEAVDPTCQVCGSKIPADLRVYCRRCRTPHHKDCWEFNGQCSTYACGEKRNMLKY
jgi:hypothetical protein